VTIDTGGYFLSVAAPTELFYDDFFEPRVQNRGIRSSKVRFHERVSVKKIKAVGKGMPVSFMDEEDSDEEEEEEEENNFGDKLTA
jgi:U3 small nucleolar RNA-associated protein MPP10